MRSARIVLLAVAGIALAGCMQTGGAAPFARTAPPLYKQPLRLRAALTPAALSWRNLSTQARLCAAMPQPMMAS